MFSAKKGCSKCPYEQSLAALSKEFESTFDGRVLKLEDSHLQRVYDVQKTEAAVVFLRKGVGILLPKDIPDTADDIFDFLNDNRDPIVKELDDSNFEHLTQASTGSTTGDWLIQFYDSQCIDCNRLSATWETVGAKLKTRMNVARVNRATKGILTAKRFKVDQVPEFIFLRMGKFYRYNLNKFDVESFVGFASSWYNRVAAEKVITPATPFETLLDFIVEKLKTFPDSALPVILSAIAFIIMLVVILMLRSSKSKGTVKEVTKKE